MHAKLLIPALSCLLFAAACEDNPPTGPSVPLNQQFTLAPGEAASIEGTSVRVQFLRVSGDSRCPADAVCIQGGDALVHVRATDGNAAEYELHTGDGSRAAATHAGLRIELVSLQPYPFSSRTIAPGEYRATLRVSGTDLRQSTILELGAPMGRVGGHQVERPTEEPGRANPEPWRHDQPEDAAQEIAVVDLPDAGDQQAEDRCHAGIPRVRNVGDDVGHTFTLYVATRVRDRSI